ncbi:unnamed protein product [Cochlearia groenlandica]
MDLDFDDYAAPAARAGARFKPKGRPQPNKNKKKKQVSLSTDVSMETLSGQIEDTVSLDASSSYPNETSSPSQTIVPESGTLSENNVDAFSRRVMWSKETSVLRTCTNVRLEEKRCDDGAETAPEFPDDHRAQDSGMLEDCVTPETDEVVHDQTHRTQTMVYEEECHLEMETLDIVQEKGFISAYEQHTGKFQPKPRLLDTVVEESEPRYFTTGTNEIEFMEPRNDFDAHTTFFEEHQEEELNIPQVPRETVPETAAQTVSGGCQHEEQFVSPDTNNTVTGAEENCGGNTAGEEERSKSKSKKGKSKKATTRKRKTPTEDETNKSTENPETKKFKHSSRRPRKIPLEKELLETPDDEIRFLPIKDMLNLVAYKEKLEKKEAKGAPVVPPTQESNTNASDNQYYSQGYDAEDEFAMEEGENQETNVVKPDSPVNYQTYMKKTLRTRWSKEDTELFYEGIREFGSNLSMVQQLFPNRTREQIKLKFKLEERRYPLKLDDALSSRSKHLKHFQNVIKKLQEEAAAAKKAEEGEEEEEEEDIDGEEEETTTNVEENEEEPTKTEEGGVKELDGGDVENEVRSDGDEEDDDFWNSYKSDM